MRRPIRLGREGRGITLTEEGVVLARIVSEFAGALESHHDACRGEPLHVVLSSGDSILQYLVIPRIGDAAFKSIRFTFENARTETTIESLLERSVDIGVIHHPAGDTPPRPLCVAPLGRMEFSLFVPRLLKRTKLFGNDVWPDLAGFPLATQSAPGTFRKMLENNLVHKSGHVVVHLNCQSFPMAGQALRNGTHAAILPSLARHEFSAPQYTEINMSALAACSYSLSLVWHPRTLSLKATPLRERSASFGALIENLKKVLLIR